MRFIFAGLTLLAATSDARRQSRTKGGCADLTTTDVASDLQSSADRYSLDRKNDKTMVLTCTRDGKRRTWSAADKSARKAWKQDLRKNRRIIYKCTNGKWSPPGTNRAPRCPSGAKNSWANFYCANTCDNGTPTSGGNWGICSATCQSCDSGYKLSNGACDKAIPLLPGKTVSHPIYTKDELHKECNNTAFDLFVLVDGSGSVWNVDYRKSIDFVEDLIEPFHIGPNNVRVSLIQYSYYTRFYGLANGNKASVKSNLNTMRNTQYRSGTRTNYGLSVVHNYATTYRRQNVPVYIIVVTDGWSYDGVSHANSCHNSGMTVFGLGVGRGANDGQLNQISTDPDSEYKYMLGDFNALNDMTVKLTIGSNVCYNGWKGAVTRSTMLPEITNFTAEPEDGDIGMTPEDSESP